PVHAHDVTVSPPCRLGSVVSPSVRTRGRTVRGIARTAVSAMMDPRGSTPTNVWFVLCNPAGLVRLVCSCRAGHVGAAVNGRWWTAGGHSVLVIVANPRG